MTPATVDPDTLQAQVEALEARRTDLTEKVARLQEEKAEAMATGSDTEALAADLRAARQKLEETEADLAALLEKAPGWRFEAARAKAVERMGTIKRQTGGLAGRVPGQVERAQELAQELAEVLSWLAGVPTHRKVLRQEARLLAEVFDLEGVELADLEPDPSRVVLEAQRTIQAVQGHGTRLVLSIGAATREGKHEKAAGKVRMQLRRLFDEDTPTPEILEELEGPEAP